MCDGQAKKNAYVRCPGTFLEEHVVWSDMETANCLGLSRIDLAYLCLLSNKAEKG